MLKRLLQLTAIILSSLSLNAQGLEGVVVERYYISDTNDTSVDGIGGMLPVGSVTYRIYVDLLPNYIFQAVYGNQDHECRIETSTLFFNNEDRGATTPSFAYSRLQDNTVMIDSWLSVGAACNGYYGVPKDEDDGMNTVVNSDGVLQNNDPLMGIPLTQEDGVVPGSPEPVTMVGISNEVLVFDNQNDGTNGPVFSTNNGSWASLNGSVGADTVENKVLIAQITTDGCLSFKLNLQIRNTITNDVEQYVWGNPTGTEIQDSSLVRDSLCLITHSSKPQSKDVISVYPNPARDHFNINIVGDLSDKKGSSYTVRNAIGSQMMYKEISSDRVSFYNEQLDISHLPQGIYFVEIITPNSKVCKRIVKQ